MSTTPLTSPTDVPIGMPSATPSDPALLIDQARGPELEMDPARPGRIKVKTDHLICEDDTPVESFYQLYQMWLLTDPLNTSWTPGRPFIVGSDVGVFFVNRNPPIVPDVFVSMDVSMREISQNDPDTAEAKSYLIWEMGKAPEVVIEIVSSRDGGEFTSKRRIYAENVKAPYYIVWDPSQRLKGDRLTIFRLDGMTYRPTNDPWIPEVGLGVRVWSGKYRGCQSDWLRWYGPDDQFIATGEEQRRRAEQAQSRADEAHSRIEQLAAKLRELGLDPDGITGKN